MRKKSIGRLLLSLLTAFVMVAGVFGAAVQTWSTTSQPGEESNPLADSELDMETREIGDAPVSALDSDSNTMDGELPGQLASINTDSDGDVNQGENYIVGDITDWEKSAADDMIEDHGTRAASVDGGGPYGERPPDGIPHIEGDPVSFDATIDGGNIDDYYFRWEVTGDDNWDLNHFPAAYGGDDTMGVPDFVHQYRDNFIGEGDVQAWDGVSYNTAYLEGQPLKGTSYQTYWYLYNAQITMGWEFDTSEEIIVDELLIFDQYYPYQVYYIDIWDTTTLSKVATVTGPSTTNYMWNSFAITPVTLPAGNYIVSAYVRTYPTNGYFPCVRQDPSDDIVTAGNVRYRAASGNSYPTTSVSDSRTPMVSFHYEYAVQVPDLLEDTADIFVDNSAPIALNPQAIGEPGLEGSEIGFTAELIDIGLDDDWFYRWDFGDGTVSDWYTVNKWSGGARILLCTSWSVNPTVATQLDAELGNFDIVIDQYNFFSSGAPDLDLLSQYDVVVVGENTITTAAVREGLGDALADYSDQGGNVVTMFVSDGDDPTYGEIGITGRWRDDNYNVFIPGSVSNLAMSMGTVFDPGHPIMQGVGAVNTWGSHIQMPGYAAGTTPLAENNFGDPFIGYKVNPIGSGGRIVGIDMYPAGSPYAMGDWLVLTANAVKWASQLPDPSLKSMPIPLDPIYHVYKDDHPTSITIEDTFDVKVEIKDDDHERIVGGSGADWTNNVAYPATPSGSGSPYRVNLWNDGILLGQNAFVWCNGLGTDNSWMEYRWSSPVYIGGFGIHQFRPSGTRQLIGCVDMQYWTGSGYASLGGYNAITDGIYTVGAPYYKLFPAPVSTTRFRLYNLIGYAYPSGQVSNPSVSEWEVFAGLTGGDPYEMFGIDDADTTCLIQNVWPTAANTGGVVLDVGENTPMLFEKFKVTDPGASAKTETFRYRWDFDDGTPRGDWIDPMAGAGLTEFRVLLFHSLNSVGISSPLATQVYDAIANCPEVISVDHFNFYEGGAYPAIPTLQNMIDNYDVIMFGSAYNMPGDTSRENFGNNLADWQDATGGGVITMMYTYGQAGSANEQWTLLGRYIDDDYGPYEKAPRLGGTRTLGTILNPGHPVMDGLTNLGNGDRHDNMLTTTPGGEIIAEWTGGYPAIGVKENPSGKTVHISGGGYTPFQGDFDVFMANAINWAGGGASRTAIGDVGHNFMDNGVYDVHLEVIDDDMNWDFSGPQPVFVGSGSEEDWIGGSIFPVSVDNTDPVISTRIRAYAQLDMRIRMSGTKTHEATMTLYETHDGSTTESSVSVTRVPGSPNIGILGNVNIMMTNDYTYELYIVVDPNGDGGANPTWIFDMVFPDGKYKEFKHTFNDEHGWDWTITDSMLKGALISHDIIFEASADDVGSDDLAFVWSFGDSTPHGIHLYANVDQTTAVNAVSDEATVIFDQLGELIRDPDFVKDDNTIRSPDGDPISVTDTISHVFDENQPYYYYVYLTVMDDDVGDDYPSMQLPHGTGYDIACVEIDLR